VDWSRPLPAPCPIIRLAVSAVAVQSHLAPDLGYPVSDTNQHEDRPHWPRHLIQNTETKSHTIRCFLIGRGLAPSIPALAFTTAFGTFPPPPFAFPFVTTPLPCTPAAARASSKSLFFPRFSPAIPLTPPPAVLLAAVVGIPVTGVFPLGVPTRAGGTCTGGTAGLLAGRGILGFIFGVAVVEEGVSALGAVVVVAVCGW